MSYVFIIYQVNIIFFLFHVVKISFGFHTYIPNYRVLDMLTYIANYNNE